MASYLTVGCRASGLRRAMFALTSVGLYVGGLTAPSIRACALGLWNRFGGCLLVGCARSRVRAARHRDEFSDRPSLDWARREIQ